MYFFLEICNGVDNNCIIQPLVCAAIWNKLSIYLSIYLKNKTYKMDNIGRLGNSPVGSCWISLDLRFLLVKNLKRKKDLLTNVTWLVTFKGSIFRNLTFVFLWRNFYVTGVIDGANTLSELTLLFTQNISPFLIG